MSIDLELLKKEYDDAVKSFETGFWSPKSGDNLIRILPPSPRESSKLFYRKVSVHYGIEGIGLVFCLQNWGQKCPVCSLIEKMKKLESVDIVNLTKRISANDRYLINIVPIDGESLSIKQWLAPKTVRLELLRVMLDSDWGDITDLHAGRNLVIEKREKVGTKYIEYGIRPKPNVSAIQIAAESIPSFTEILESNKKTYEELKLSMFGEGTPEENEVEVYLKKVAERSNSKGNASDTTSDFKESSKKSTSNAGINNDELVKKAMELLLKEQSK